MHALMNINIYKISERVHCSLLMHSKGFSAQTVKNKFSDIIGAILEVKRMIGVAS